MLKGENIICFSSKDWVGFSRTSKEYLMEILSRQNRVLYVETMGSRNPGMRKKDLGRILKRLLKASKGPVRPAGIAPEQQLFIYSPLLIPFHENPWARKINDWILKATFRALIKKLKLEKPVLWFYLPTASGLIGQLDEKAVIYHLVDKWATYPGFRGEFFRAADERLLRHADLVVVSNRLLLEENKELNKNIHYLPHGVNFQDFDKNPESRPLPEDIAKLPRPMIAMVGAVSNWTDWEKLRYAAGKHPDWSFVLIGDVGFDADVSKVAGISNIHVLGKKDYTSLQDYYRGIDACVVSFLPTEHIKYCCPTRFYEHLAAGKPIVSTDFPAAREFPPELVRIGATNEEFCRAIEESLGLDSRERMEKRKILAAENTWQNRAQKLSELIQKCLQQKN